MIETSTSGSTARAEHIPTLQSAPVDTGREAGRGRLMSDHIIAILQAENARLREQLEQMQMALLAFAGNGCSCATDGGPRNLWCALHGDQGRREFTIANYATLSRRTIKAEKQLEQAQAERDAIVDDVRNLTRAGVPYDHERVYIRRLRAALEGNPTKYITSGELAALSRAEDAEARLAAAEAKAALADEALGLMQEARAVASNAYRSDAGHVADAQRFYELAGDWLGRYDALNAQAPGKSEYVEDDNWFPIVPDMIDIEVEIDAQDTGKAEEG